MAPTSAYIHVPFCHHRCGYCNFTVVAGRDDLADQYLDALAQELSWLSEPRPVRTLFVGGGTPTHLTSAQLERLGEIVLQWFPLEADYEFTVEANPVDITSVKAKALSELGASRISLGVQSFNDKKLATLERDHRQPDVQRGYALLRDRFPWISLDLIFGVPGESLDVWRRDLESMLELRPEHISTYGLTFERGTQFWNRLQRGELNALVDETELKMYELAIESLTAAGYEHYEVSNFALPEQRCRHNEVYWAGDEYFAAGAGAARYIDGRRETNHRSPFTYLKRVLANESPVADSEKLDDEDRARELLVLGMRRIEGVDRRLFHDRTGFFIEDLVGEALKEFVSQEFIEDTGTRIRLTRKGLMISDSLWPEFLKRETICSNDAQNSR